MFEQTMSYSPKMVRSLCLSDQATGNLPPSPIHIGQENLSASIDSIYCTGPESL